MGDSLSYLHTLLRLVINVEFDSCEEIAWAFDFRSREVSSCRDVWSLDCISLFDFDSASKCIFGLLVIFICKQ